MDWEWLAHDAAKLCIAVILGGAIGLEREMSDKPAGLRTNILIAIGSTLITIVSVRFAERYAADPSRVAAQIVTGVGFLGAGSILQTRASVVGLTTAATIWAVAGIGIAIGADHSTLAVTGTMIILLCLTLLRPLEGWMVRRHERLHLHLVLELETAAKEVIHTLTESGVKVESSSVMRSAAPIEMDIVCVAKPHQSAELPASLLTIAGVKSVVVET